MTIDQIASELQEGVPKVFGEYVKKGKLSG
jgi:hypothetical protein